MMDNVQAVASTASSPYLETVKTWVTYVGVLAVAVVTAYAGIRKALKDLKTGEVSGATKDKVVAATLIETHTMMVWSDSNRAVVEALHEMTVMLTRLCERIDIVEELKKEAVELRHQIERLRDRI